jgi:hypothetical protein
MSVVAEDRGLATAPHAAAERPHRPALILSAAAALCLVGAGLLLWWRYGDAVFSDTVLAALAWCF